MSTRELSKRELLLRQRAARMVERSLPDEIGRAYGTAPSEPADLPGSDANPSDLRERARAALVKQGVLTAEELDTLSADEALAAARQRVRDQVAQLQDQAEQQSRHEPSAANARDKPPRTLRR